MALYSKKKKKKAILITTRIRKKDPSLQKACYLEQIDVKEGLGF